MPASFDSRLPRRRTLVAAATAAALGVLGVIVEGAFRSTSAAAQNGPQTATACNVTTPERVVAIGDIHGFYDGFVTILRAAALIDSRDRWIGGRSHLVQTGDVLDRGADSRRVLDLLRRLERDAARDGGRVYPLLGNHEVMRMVGDWRYVSAGEYAAFRNADSQELRERVYASTAENVERELRRAGTPFDKAAFRAAFLEDTPLGALEMIRQFDPAGDYGKWLSSHDTMVRINGVVFVHGGINAATAAMGCDEVNATVRREIAAGKRSAQQTVALFATSEAGPLWFRGLATEPQDAFAPTVTEILNQLGARAIVIGHTPSLGRIVTRFDGRVVQIDTGMLDGEAYPGGVPSALEIQGSTATAIYANRREPVPFPAR